MTNSNSTATSSFLHRGVIVPRFMYGTAWKEEQTERLTYAAIKAGFRSIDTANQRKHYFEAAVGDAINNAITDGLVQRSDLFLQTKFTFANSQDHRLPYDINADYATQVKQSFELSLAHLHTDYLDSYILHGPITRSDLTASDLEVWRAMEELYKGERVKLLGISNVNYEQLQALLEHSEIKPAFVQNRCYARLQWDAQIRALCRQHDVIYQGFSLLTANSRELQHPDLLKIAQRLGCTSAQLIFRFAIALTMLPLTGTSNEQHMQADLACLNLTLSEADIQIIEQIAVIA